MSECEPTEPQRVGGEADLPAFRLRTIHPRSPFLPTPQPFPQTTAVCFDRHELRIIFDLYGRKVAAGEWRDYAIDFEQDCAFFSIFRRSSEVPIYTIAKEPKRARKQGAYSVVAATGLVLERGHDLAKVISVLDKRLKLIVA